MSRHPLLPTSSQNAEWWCIRGGDGKVISQQDRVLIQGTRLWDSEASHSSSLWNKSSGTFLEGSELPEGQMTGLWEYRNPKRGPLPNPNIAWLHRMMLEMPLNARVFWGFNTRSHLIFILNSYSLTPRRCSPTVLAGEHVHGAMQGAYNMPFKWHYSVNLELSTEGIWDPLARRGQARDLKTQDMTLFSFPGSCSCSNSSQNGVKGIDKHRKSLQRLAEETGPLGGWDRYWGKGRGNIKRQIQTIRLCSSLKQSTHCSPILEGWFNQQQQHATT